MSAVAVMLARVAGPISTPIAATALASLTLPIALLASERRRHDRVLGVFKVGHHPTPVRRNVVIVGFTVLVAVLAMYAVAADR